MRQYLPQPRHKARGQDLKLTKVVDGHFVAAEVALVQGEQGLDQAGRGAGQAAGGAVDIAGGVDPGAAVHPASPLVKAGHRGRLDGNFFRRLPDFGDGERVLINVINPQIQVRGGSGRAPGVRASQDDRLDAVDRR